MAWEGGEVRGKERKGGWEGELGLDKMEMEVEVEIVEGFSSFGGLGWDTGHEHEREHEEHEQGHCWM